MFNFCPSCASKNITFNEGKVFRCPDCGFIYYHNIAAATGCIISVPETKHNIFALDDVSNSIDSYIEAADSRLLFLVRGKEPAAGKLDLPGGFVDIGEGAAEGLYRELQEEIGWTPPVPEGVSFIDIFKLFASFSNIYEYKGISYNTCDMYFHVCAPGLMRENLHLEESEIAGALFLKPHEVDFSQFAFQSTIKAVKKYFKMFKLRNI